MIRHIFQRSFRLRLFAAFFLASAIPLLICSFLLSQVIRIRLERELSQQNQDHISVLADLLQKEEDALRDCSRKLAGSGRVTAALKRSSVDGADSPAAGPAADQTLINNILFDAVRGMPMEAGFDLYDRNGNILFSTQNTESLENLSPSWGILNEAAGADDLVYSATEDPTDTASPLYRAAYRITDEDGMTAGYFVANIYHSGFRRYLEGKYGTRSTLMLLSSYYRPVYCVQPLLAVSLASPLRSGILAGTNPAEIENDYRYAVSPGPSCGLYVVLRTPAVFTTGMLRLLQTITLLVVLLSLLVSALLAIRLSGQIYEPIDRLHNAMQQVSMDNLDIYVEPVQKDELGELTERFNRMTSALKYNREELLKNQKELNEAQIRMLQAQLNPHFLSNTLDTMKWISKINQVPQLATMAIDLADILRFGISPAEFVTLEDELRVLERYIEIQKIRLSDKFSFTLQVQDGLRSCIIPKMILQPLVENSILHGIDGNDNGTIALEISDLAQTEHSPAELVIAVRDNGVGFPSGMTGAYRKPENSGNHHLGLYNVNTILKKHYGNQYGLFLANETDADGKVLGAVITAKLPLSFSRSPEPQGE